MPRQSAQGEPGIRFRLPSALDNRPLRLTSLNAQCISNLRLRHPGCLRIDQSPAGGTGHPPHRLVDPEVEVRPLRDIDDLMEEIRSEW